ncbi:MAG: hypothetical protein ABEH88_00065 [Halobacteriales archaeon]
MPYADFSGREIVTVPMKQSDQISQDTYRSIADQCGANDFDAWCE